MTHHRVLVNAGKIDKAMREMRAFSKKSEAFVRMCR
jgi:hypothetical protein